MLDCRRFEIDASRHPCPTIPIHHAPPFAASPRQGRTLRARRRKTMPASLIERGRKDAAKIGAYMAGHALDSRPGGGSPAARTQETWKYAAAAFHPAPAAMSAERLYDATPHAILGGHQGHPGVRPYAAGHRPQSRPARARADADRLRRHRCARAAAREAADLGAGHHRFRLRRLEQAASAVRPAGALRQPEVAGSRRPIEATSRTQRRRENMS